MKRAIMKLSEAIREGAKMRPQARAAWFTHPPYEIQSCALAAALEGCGAVTLDTELSAIELGWLAIELWPELAEEITNVFPHRQRIRMIQHWNDYQFMSREQIADILEREGY